MNQLPRGGKRQPTPGRTYSNRRDLNPPGVTAPPNTVAIGQPYGAATNQIRSLQAVPLAAPGAPTVGNAVAGAGEQAGGPPLSHARIVPLDAPTQRPSEPVTAGVNVGPGPGAPTPPPTEDIERMRSWMPALEIMAAMPEASTETRNLVRYWRSFLP